MLDIRVLRYFIAVAENLHFARAADRLCVAQSAVSTQIKRLEEQLGTALFNRGKRAAVSLTEAGRLVLAEARLTIRQLERTVQIGTMAGRGEMGHLQVGFVASAAMTGFLPALLRRFHSQHPFVQLNVIQRETPRQLTDLVEGQLDLAIVRPRAAYPAGVIAQTIHTEDLCIAMPQTHPLASQQVVRAADLAHERFVIPEFDDEAGFASSLNRLSQVGAFDVQALHKVTDFVTALCLSAGNYGLVLGPTSMRNYGIAGLAFRSLTDLHERVALALAQRERELSPAAEAFRDEAIELARRSNTGIPEFGARA